MPESNWMLSLGVAVVAFIYSLVGHGGASGYLGLLTHSSLPVGQVPIVALLINCVVASASFFMFKQAKGFRWNLCWPFLLGSMPLALIGSRFKLEDKAYYWLVAFALVVSAARLLWSPKPEDPSVPLVRQSDTTDSHGGSYSSIEKPMDRSAASFHPGIAIAIGAAIGLLSGMIGVGGGIFLSPILLLTKWAEPKTTSATSAIFIVGNSLVGLGGRLTAGAVIPLETAAPLVAAGLIGGLGGAFIGAFKVPPKRLQQALGLVLVFAAVKLILK